MHSLRKYFFGRYLGAYSSPVGISTSDEMLVGSGSCIKLDKMMSCALAKLVDAHASTGCFWMSIFGVRLPSATSFKHVTSSCAFSMLFSNWTRSRRRASLVVKTMPSGDVDGGGSCSDSGSNPSSTLTAVRFAATDTDEQLLALAKVNVECDTESAILNNNSVLTPKCFELGFVECSRWFFRSE